MNETYAGIKTTYLPKYTLRNLVSYDWRHIVSVWTVQGLILPKASVLTEIGKGYELWESDSLELDRFIRT